MLTDSRYANQQLHLALLASAFALVLPSITAVAQTDSGWKAATGSTARLGGEEKKSPLAVTAAAAASPSPAGAPAAQPGGDITPVGGGLAPVDAGITRARVTKGSGALPQDQGQVWREY